MIGRRILGGLLLLAACGPAGGPSSGTLATRTDTTTAPRRPPPDPTTAPKEEVCVEATLEAIRQDIFLPSCATEGCHAGAAPRADLDLSLELDALKARLAASSKQSPSGMPLVNPGQPSSSYLYLKVFLETPLIGASMPKDATLEDCEIAAIRAYIEG